MNIFEALRQDHQTQRTLVALLIKTHGDSKGREELFGRLKDALERHAKAEERCFYVPLLKSDLSQEHARHSVAEHQEIDKLIEKLETTERESSGWLATAKKLEERVTHHLDEEENQVFQIAGKVLTERQKTDLAKAYSEVMEAEAAA